MRTVQMELLRPEEIRQEQARISLVYLPVGPVEWHSYHMPLGTDGLIAQEVARGLAQVTGGVVAPTLFMGTEKNDTPEMLDNLAVPHDEHSYIIGMDFPKNILPSMYLHEEVFAVIVREEMRLLAKMGFRMIAISNGHGAYGQVSTLGRLCDEVQAECNVQCLFLDADTPITDALLAAEHADGGHADRLETAMMMAASDSVDLSRLPSPEVPLHSADFGIASGSQFGGVAPKDGVVTDDPRNATAAFGRAVFDALVKDTAPYVLEQYQQRVLNA